MTEGNDKNRKSKPKVQHKVLYCNIGDYSNHNMQHETVITTFIQSPKNHFEISKDEQYYFIRKKYSWQEETNDDYKHSTLRKSIKRCFENDLPCAMKFKGLQFLSI